MNAAATYLNVCMSDTKVDREYLRPCLIELKQFEQCAKRMRVEAPK